jgi:hypothetical protein
MIQNINGLSEGEVTYMKMISRALAVVMIMTLCSFPVVGVSVMTPDELIATYVDRVVNLQHKELLIELLRVVQNVDDAQALMNAYNNAFSSLSGGQQDHLNSMGYILTSLAVINDSLFDSEFSVDTFADYIGLGADSTVKTNLLIAKLKTQETAIVNSLGSLDQGTIDLGFTRLNKLFDLLNDVKAIKSMQIAHLFQVTSITAADMVLINDNVDMLVLFLGAKNSSFITDTASIKAGMNQFVSYYNQTSGSNRSIIASYFDTYGLLRIVSTTGGSIGGNPGGVVPPSDGGNGIDTETDTSQEEDFFNEEIPEGIKIFGDIGNVSWAWTAINKLYGAQIIKGKTLTKFEPQSNITRAEFAAMLTRLFEIELETTDRENESVFVDVKRSDWFYNEVMSVYNKGYVKGKGENLFSPNVNISREEIATVLARILIEKGIRPSTKDFSSVLNQFADASTVSEWAKEGTVLTFEKGIITGTTENKIRFYNFKKYASRAEVAVMLYRIAGIIKTKVIVN